MFVISRNTAFTHRNKPVDTKQIGRELGVRYVLEGSVRRSGNQVRVNPSSPIRPAVVRFSQSK
jgi:TolB-like protein